MIFCRLWPDNVLKSLLSAVAVGYNQKINLADERRPLCLSRGQVARCFLSLLQNWCGELRGKRSSYAALLCLSRRTARCFGHE